MNSDQDSRLRDLAAVAIVAIACPLAFIVGVTVGCVGQGFSADCAMAAVFISPVLLLAAGLVAGLVTRGWTGLLLMYVGVVIGMSAILVYSFAVDRPVPFDPIAGFIATLWFLLPVVIGYGMGRLVSRLLATRDEGGGNGDDAGG